MHLKLPESALNPFALSDNENVLDYQIMHEKAVTLGMLGSRLTRALKNLAEEKALETRNDLIIEAADALYELVVHREACGFCCGDDLFKQYDVPSIVRARMGPKSY